MTFSSSTLLLRYFKYVVPKWKAVEISLSEENNQLKPSSTRKPRVEKNYFDAIFLSSNIRRFCGRNLGQRKGGKA